MQNNLIDKQLVDSTMAQCGVSNLDDASIRDTVKITNLLEKATGEKFIRMEMGVPGLAPSRIGTEAEINALQQGVAQFYPMLEGYPELSQEASRFVKNFMDIDIRPEGIIPTVGAMQASYVAFMALTECRQGKDTILFIDPGFPVQKPNWKSLVNLILLLTYMITGAKNWKPNSGNILTKATLRALSTAIPTILPGFASPKQNCKSSENWPQNTIPLFWKTLPILPWISGKTFPARDRLLSNRL